MNSAISSIYQMQEHPGERMVLASLQLYNNKPKQYISLGIHRGKQTNIDSG